MPEQFIAHYKITGKLGAGGMGEVFQATDTKLDREVAIKVLPDSFTGDKERLARFDREAKVLASLNHSNIAAIYGLEESGGTHALVLELVEGETLAERLKKGPLPVEEALEVCKGIAEALEAAHEKGIIHRDLKPGNVKFARDCKVKVLDFGLAKALSEEQPSELEAGQSDSPTITDHYTKPGTILGTAAYMSPEQARGKPVDKRTDIWSFGCVLYECLTGECLFKGEDVTETLAKIIEREPNWSALPENTPPTIQLLLRKCLTKDRERRLHDIADARVDLEQGLADPSSSFIRLTDEALLDTKGKTGNQRLVVAGGVLLACLAGAALGWFFKPTPPPSPVHHVGTTLDGDVPLATRFGNAFALSKDGRQLVYITGDWTASRLHLRQLDEAEDTELKGIERGSQPFFSPDGQSIGFVSGGQLLKTLRWPGGQPRDVARVHYSRGSAWGEDGVIVYAPNIQSGLSRVSAPGGDSTELTKLEDGEVSHRWPQFLPDGRHVLFTAYNSLEGMESSGHIKVVDVLTGDPPKSLGQVGTFARYASGRLLWVRDRMLYAARFDANKLKVTGTPTPLLEVITTEEGAAQYAVSDNGVLAYLDGESESLTSEDKELIWLDADGTTTQVTDQRRIFSRGAISPNGQHIALQVWEGGKPYIYVLDIKRSILELLVRNDGPERVACWSHDGKWIYFGAQRDGKWGIYRRRYPLEGEPELLHQGEYFMAPDCATEDYLVYVEVTRETSNDIWLLPLNGDSKPKPFHKEPFHDGAPKVSKDGNWIAYASASSPDSDSNEIYVQPFPEGGQIKQISQGGGWSPVWSRDGRRLIYRHNENGENRMMVAPFKVEGDDFVPDRPKELLQLPPGFQPFFEEGDNGRYLMIRDAEVATFEGPNTIKLIFNFQWLEQVR